MKYDFSKIPAEQLGILFPIILTEYDPCWTDLYANEAEQLIKL